MHKFNTDKTNTGTAILISVMVFLLAGIYQSWQNNLYYNGNWTSSKAALKKGVMGSVSFMVTHLPLAGNHLNLGAWNGFQEVFLKKKYPVKTLECSFLLDTIGEFHFLFNKTDTFSQGIRISNRPGCESGFFETGTLGEFKRFNPINIKKLPFDQWHKFKIEFEEGKVKVFLNGKFITTIYTNYSKEQTIGFRAGEKKMLIDDIVIKSNNNEILFRESFNQKNTFIKAFTISALAGLLAFLLFGFLNLTISVFLLYSTVLMTCVVVAFSIAYWSTWQYQYPRVYWFINWHDYKNTVESGERVFTRLKQDNEVRETGDEQRIVFVGSSQTRGAGATSEGNTFVRQFEKMINSLSNGKRYKCINFSSGGLTSIELLRDYKQLFDLLKPDITIINLSNNDINQNAFKTNLEAFVSWNNAKGVKTIFVLEPNEPARKRLLENHAIMRKVGIERKVPVIDMFSYMQSKCNEGFLWWDFVHLSDFGQYVFAKQLLKNFINLKLK